LAFDIGEWPLWAGALLIFFARVTDVTLGTLRISFISRGEKSLAPIVAYFEMMVWLFAISQIFQNLTNVAYYVAYAGGFAMGVFTGLRVEDRIALGSRMIRTITQEDASELTRSLRNEGFGVTSLRAAGASGDVNVIFSVIKRADVPRYMYIIRQHHPEAFASVEDVRSVQRGVVGVRRPPLSFGGAGSFLLWKK
jgi:uncharacterized protein YebE (UPF0316 family)